MIETFSEPLPEDIHELAALAMTRVCDRGRLLSVAESCTGGLLAAVLTDVEGCSHGFDRGFVAYTDDAKRELLNVPAAVLERVGAVSEAAAKAMAEGALAASKADLAVSVTGFAGPGAPGEEPGLVFIARAMRGGGLAVLERRFGDATRAQVRRACLRTALTFLLDAP